MSELQGLVLKNYNGYYYVKVEDDIFTCKVKGRMKQNRFSLATGDLVLLEAGKAGEGMIKRVLPRKNFLPRPTMANLDLFVATFACAAPDFSFLLADKLLALAELAKIPTILVLNKEDQAPSGLIERVRGIYEAIGYEVFTISAKNGTGVEALRERLKGKICAFGGPSGVGKSSTINAIDRNVDLRTGAVSEKIGRGKHTTRFAQLLPFDEGYIADTPGFASFDVDMVDPISCENLQYAFREFRPYIGQCRFRDCAHLKEPGCAVLAAVEAGKIAPERHESYARLYALSAQVCDWEKKK